MNHRDHERIIENWHNGNHKDARRYLSRYDRVNLLGFIGYWMGRDKLGFADIAARVIALIDPS